jgi:uncharacterized protein (TIGR00369 family)
VTGFKPKFDGYDKKVRDSFARQPVMQTLGISIDSLSPGELVLSMPYDKTLTQQHGFIHAGVLTTGMDSAAGYAAFSLMPEDAAVLTVELKTSLMAPADGDRFLFKASVIKPGRTLTFVEARAYALNAGEEKLVASMTATMMAVVGRDDVVG